MININDSALASIASAKASFPGHSWIAEDPSSDGGTLIYVARCATCNAVLSVYDFGATLLSHFGAAAAHKELTP